MLKRAQGPMCMMNITENAHFRSLFSPFSLVKDWCGMKFCIEKDVQHRLGPVSGAAAELLRFLQELSRRILQILRCCKQRKALF